MRLPIVFAIFLAACSPISPEVFVGQQTLNLKAAGLWLTSNPLDAPPGALANAQNAVIRRPNVVEPRRGQKPDAPLSAPADAMATFEGAVIAHSTDGVLARRVDATSVSAYTGTWDPPDGYPMRFAEAGGGLYATTDEGPIRLDSSTSEWFAAGAPPGLEGNAATTGASGWLATGSTVAYRLVWGRRDGDGAVLLGAPSGRIVVSNTSGAGRDVLVTAVIPDDVILDRDFLQIYRTVITATSPADPGEDMAQIAEVSPTAADITARTMSVVDIASFANGPSAYFNPSNGGGLADAKEQPPLLSDAIAFKGYLFGTVAGYRQSLLLSLLGVNGATSLALGDGIEFSAEGGAWSEGFIASGAPEGTLLVGSPPHARWAFTMATGGTASQNIEATARSLIRVMNLKAVNMMGTYASGPSDLPGQIVATQRALDVDGVYVRAIVNGVTWVPGLRVYNGADLSRVANVVTATTTGAHHLAANQSVVIISTDPNFASGTKTVVATPTSSTFTYAETGINATALAQEFRTTTPDVELMQAAVPGSWATSAFEEPDAWPPRFRYQVGGPNTRLDRITSQGEALLFWTSDGLYRLTGDDEDSFTLRPLDPTIQLVGGQTPITVGNRVFAFTTQGVVSVSELGVEKVSTPLDVALLPYYASTDERKEITEAAAFGVGYQSENEYILFLPAPDASPGDPADRAYTYNTQTRTWVGPWIFEWSTLNPTDHFVTTGIVGPDNRLYVAAGDNLTRERKDRALSDQQDADGVGIPYDVAYLVQTAGNPGAYKQWIECTEMLEAPQPSAVELYFATEIDTSEEGGSIPSQGNSNVRTYIPLNKSRSARLTVGLRHETPLEKPTILGLSVVYNVNGTRVGR